MSVQEEDTSQFRRHAADNPEIILIKFLC